MFYLVVTAKLYVNGLELGLSDLSKAVLARLFAQVQHFKTQSFMKFKVQVEMKSSSLQTSARDTFTNAVSALDTKVLRIRKCSFL